MAHDISRGTISMLYFVGILSMKQTTFPTDSRPKFAHENRGTMSNGQLTKKNQFLYFDTISRIHQNMEFGKILTPIVPPKLNPLMQRWSYTLY